LFRGLVGSEMCIRDRVLPVQTKRKVGAVLDTDTFLSKLMKTTFPIGRFQLDALGFWS
jgi:hypothetical protein